MESRETITADEVGGLEDVLKPGDPVFQDGGYVETTTSRAEHLAYCKRRALACIDAGEIAQAFASMASDLNAHPKTRNHGALELGMMLLMAGKLSTPVEMRRFIEGFN